MMVVITVYGPNEDTLKHYCSSISNRDAFGSKGAAINSDARTA